MAPDEVADRVCTKLINPTTVPTTLKELQIEHALAIEAIRLAFDQHKEVATSPPKTAVGWRGLLGQEPIVTAQPETMPHLGVLSEMEPGVALQVLERDCFVPLGPVITVEGAVSEGKPVVELRCTDSCGQRHEAVVRGGDTFLLPAAELGGPSLQGERTGAGNSQDVTVTALGGTSIGGRSEVRFACETGSPEVQRVIASADEKMEVVPEGQALGKMVAPGIVREHRPVAPVSTGHDMG